MEVKMRLHRVYKLYKQKSLYSTSSYHSTSTPENMINRNTK